MSEQALLLPPPGPADGVVDVEGVDDDTAMLLRNMQNMEARMVTSIQVRLRSLTVAAD